MDSNSEESYVLTKNSSGVIQSIRLNKREQSIVQRVGIERAPRRYVDGEVEVSRSFMAKKIDAAECVGHQRCYQVFSRLVLNVGYLAFSPSKNSAIKFKERDSRYDMRFSFVLIIDDDTQSLKLDANKNNLFVKGERMKFSKDRGFLYNGKLALTQSSPVLELNGSANNNCGYFMDGTVAFSFNWGRRASLLRSMERSLDSKVLFSSEQIVTRVSNSTEQLLERTVLKNSCSNISHSYIGPFFNLYALFSY
jgi:hypothetical protein